MDQLSDITDEQVSELQTSILSEFESVEKEDPTPQIVDAMTSLADMLDGVRNEIKRRETANAELAQKAAEATTRVYGKEDEKELYQKNHTLRSAKALTFSYNMDDSSERFGFMKQSDWESQHGTLSEAKKRAIEKQIDQIEKMGEVAAWENRIMKIQEKIDELTNKMTVTEGDDVKDMVDKKAVKELKKDIALLTKKKALYEKQKTKAAGRVKDKSAMQTAAGEGTTVMEKEEKPFTPPTDPDRERAFASMKRDTAPKPKKESWSGMVRELINTKNLKVK